MVDFVVSRSATQRVKNPLPIPTHCRYCGEPVKRVSNSEIYNGREFGEWPFAYLCQNKRCGAYVGLHPHTSIPLGLLADETLRWERKRMKPFFEQLWRGPKPRFRRRSEAYAWLADQLGIPVAACHWGWFDFGQCSKAGEICQKAGR